MLKYISNATVEKLFAESYSFYDQIAILPKKNFPSSNKIVNRMKSIQIPPEY